MLAITIVLTEGYSDWEIGVLAGIGRAFYVADVRFVSAEGGPVTAISGLKTQALERISAPDSGVVVVCGGPTFESDTPPEIEGRLKQAHENGCVIAGICGGTLALARAGLLDEAAHTSNGLDYLQAVKTYRGAAHYRDQPQAVGDGRVITAPAPAPASFAVEVLTAAGIEAEAAGVIMGMLSREHARLGS
ncbi:MAG: glutamine amidotransferase [Rhizobiales bacterium]|nr:glutamine amidotransferase [Hyphomicrobiales bacterium]|tara:strand:+ start:2076 stop:2645 length:570 start_codon:yes stop_codon:yes gene_type:complete